MSWKYIRFGDLFDYENKSKIKAGEGLVSGEYPFYTSSVELTKFIDEFQFQKTSLIFGTGGNASIHYCDTFFSVSTDCLVTYAKDETQVYPRFVFFYLSGNINLLEEGFKGAGLKHISKSYINDILIPLPPLSTQKRIAEILDAADALKRKDQALLKKYDELAQAIFIDLFGDPVKNEKGWEVKKCSELFDMKLGKMLSAKKYVGTHLKKYLRNINVQWGYLEMSDLNEMDFFENEKEKYLLKKGDILVCEGGEVGRTAIFNEDGEFYYQNALHRLREKKDGIINAIYFAHYMKIAVAKGLIDKLTISVTIKHFTLEKFKELEIVVPDFELQRNFALKIENLLKLKEKVITNDALFNSLIQKAFKGELVA